MDLIYSELKHAYVVINGLPWATVPVCLGCAGVTYVVYSFGVKPFLSPLRKIPGPGYNPVYGNVREAMVGEAMETSVKWVKTYGGVMRFYHLLGRERVLITDPQALRHIMVTNVSNYPRPQATNLILRSGIFVVSGEEHRYMRRLMNPHFSHLSVQEYLVEFKSFVWSLIDYWNEKLLSSENGEMDLDVQEDLFRVTFDVIGKTVFGYDFNSLREPDSPVVKAFHFITSLQAVSFTSAIPWLQWLPTKQNKKFQECVKVVDNVIFKIIQEKRELLKREGKEKINRDFLGKLMLAKDEETGEGCSEQHLRDQVLSLLIAGHETTATTLSWLLWTLSQHEDIQVKARQEATQVLPSRDQPVTWDDLDKLQYLTTVIKEGQRMYPAAPSFSRRALKDDVINGYNIPAGTTIIFHVGAMMRNPKIWPEPEKFDPDRFRDGDPDLYTYLPFITGPHKCLGHQFAKIQIRLVLASLLKEFQFKSVPGFKPKRKFQVVLKAAPSIRLRVSTTEH